MRIALISDIHGNLVSLEAVLSDIERENVDSVVCLGDVVATGPQPVEVVERLMGLDFPTVMGNADEEMLGGFSILSDDDGDDARRVSEIDRWCAGRLAEDHLEYLRTLQKTLESSLDGDGKLLCFHGSPRSNTEVIVAETPEKELDEMFSDASESVVAGGHTHAQMLRRYGSSTLVNPGSVGLPVSYDEDGAFNPPWAEYAVVSAAEGASSVELRRVPVDVEEVRRSALESAMPHARWWASDWRG